MYSGINSGRLRSATAIQRDQLFLLRCPQRIHFYINLTEIASICLLKCTYNVLCFLGSDLFVCSLLCSFCWNVSLFCANVKLLIAKSAQRFILTWANQLCSFEIKPVDIDSSRKHFIHYRQFPCFV